MVRFAQLASCCQVGFGSYREQPLPAPHSCATLPQADSVQPRVLVSWARLVPPTATTYGEAAGYATLMVLLEQS